MAFARLPSKNESALENLSSNNSSYIFITTNQKNLPEGIKSNSNSIIFENFHKFGIKLIISVSAFLPPLNNVLNQIYRFKSLRNYYKL